MSARSHPNGSPAGLPGGSSGSASNAASNSVSDAAITRAPAGPPASLPRAPVRQRRSGGLRAVARTAAPLDSSELWLAVQIDSGLQPLAVRAQRFTPRVSLVPPDGLLLEIQGSLHLFGGVQGLLRELAGVCAALNIRHVFAVAPTPLAALVAARAGQSCIITSPAQLVGQLAGLPLAPLRWPAEVLERLACMGVRTIGQVLRLPRAGFVRRFGVLQLAELDRLTGRSPDLRAQFRPRERFRRRRELTYELENNTVLLNILQPLLTELEQFLRSRQCAVTALDCVLRHRHADPTHCLLRLAAPTADIAHLRNLLSEKLDRLVLPEPVRSCELRSGVLVEQVQQSQQLWRPGQHGGGSGVESPHLLERLRARLGTAAVHGLQVVAGHRPEKSWQVRETAEAASHAMVPWRAAQRPLWLLPQPQLLTEQAGWPQRDGPLQLAADIERIESGWWDGQEIARDYYRARDAHGVQLWIFRERAQPHRWYLHGLFG
jgi:protein ImuB